MVPPQVPGLVVEAGRGSTAAAVAAHGGRVSHARVLVLSMGKAQLYTNDIEGILDKIHPVWAIWDTMKTDILVKITIWFCICDSHLVLLVDVLLVLLVKRHLELDAVNGRPNRRRSGPAEAGTIFLELFIFECLTY